MTLFNGKYHIINGSKKMELNLGETKIVIFTITPKMVEVTGIALKKIVEGGDYTLTLGTCFVEGESG